MTCPNPNTPEFQQLIDEVGEERAWFMWDLHSEGGEGMFGTSEDIYDNSSAVYNAAGQVVDPDLQKLHQKQILSLENRRKELKGEFNPVKRSGIYSRMQVINESISRLKNEISYDNIVKVALRDLREAKKVAETAELSGREILFLKSTLDRLVTLDEAIPVSKRSQELNIKLQYLRTQASDLLDQGWKKHTKKLVSDISSSEGRPATLESLITAVEDVSSSKMLFLGLDTTHVPILRLMDSMFETVKRKTNLIMSDFNKDFDALKSKFNTKEDFKTFLDSDGRIITATRAQYFIDEREMLQKFNMMCENPKRGDLKAAYQMKDDFYRDRNDYTLTKEGEQLYNERLQALKDDMADENGVLDAQSTEYIAQWELERSPYLGIKYAQGGKQVFGNFLWQQYLNSTPKKEWVNPEYEKIKDNELYKFVVGTITEGMKKIPHSMTMDLNSFDKALNSILFDFNKENKFVLKAAYDGVGDFMKDTFTTAISNQTLNGYSGAVVDEKGAEKPKLQPKSIQQLQQEKQFDNPLDLVKDFFSLAVAYEHKSEIEPVTWLLYGLLDEQKAIKKNKSGIGLKLKSGEDSTLEGGLVNAKKMAMTNILAELYGKRRLDVENIRPTESQVRTFRSEYNKWLERKKEARRNNVPFNEPEPVMNKISAIKSIDAIVDFTRLNLLWFKPFSAITNLMIGLQGNFLHAARNTDFNDANLFDALKMLGNSTLKYTSLGKLETPAAKKITIMSKIMGIAEESFIEDSASYKSKIVSFGLTWQTSGEYILANQIMIAKMLNVKIKNLAGEEKTLWSAFDNEGNFNTAEFGEMNELEIKKVKDRIREVRKQSQGDYQNVMQIKGGVAGRVLMLFRTWLPRAVHNRFGGQVGQEFKGRYLTYRDVGQSYIENNGFWKGTGKMIGSQLLATLTKVANIPGFSQLGMNSLSELCNEKYESQLKEMGLTDLDIQNMRVNIRELQYLVYMSLILMTLAAMAGDEPPDKELTSAINIGTRLYQDMSFFYSFNSATSITKDPIPIYKTIQDASVFIGNTYNYIEDPTSDIYERGRHQDGSKLEQSAYKLLPGLSAYQSTMNTMSQVFGTKAHK
jgi:hypothetical protein